MEALEADLRLALEHVQEVEIFIAEQRSRIDVLRERGSSTVSEQHLLEVLLNSHDLLIKHLEYLKRLHFVT